MCFKKKVNYGKIFNKLVCDNISDKIKNNGEEAVIRILSLEEYKIELYKKLEGEKIYIYK